MSYFFSPNSGADLSGYVQLININTIAGLNSVVADATVATVSQVVSDATGSRTLTPADSGKYIILGNVTSNTLGLVLGDDGDFPLGMEIYFRRATGAGEILFSASGITINGDASIADVAENDNFALKKVGTATWDLI